MLHHDDVTFKTIAIFLNLELYTLSLVKTTGKFGLNFVVLASRDKNELYCYVMRFTRLPERSQRPYHVTAQIYYYVMANVDALFGIFLVLDIDNYNGDACHLLYTSILF